MHDIFIGRQPIYDRSLDVYAYELLYRGSEQNRAVVIDGDQATSRVILNAFMEIGLNQIVGQRPAFINLTRGFLVDRDMMLPADKVVLEVLEDVVVDEPLIRGVRRLCEQGYRIALDDFTLREELLPLVDLAHVIKIDVMALDRAAVREHVSRLRRYKTALLAEKVETREDFEFCRRLGFDYFQGYFFCRPSVIKGQGVPANRIALLHLLSELYKPDVDMRRLEELISHDVSLSYRLLRYMNSAFFSLPNKIESIHRAVVFLGLQVIKIWVTVIALSGIGDKPHELMTTLLVRAKMCELLASAMRRDGPEIFFTVGLFSGLDALLDAPMNRILDSLPLSDEIERALLHQEGPLGEVLRYALAYERGDWDAATCRDLDQSSIRDAYLGALAWADRAAKELMA